MIASYPYQSMHFHLVFTIRRREAFTDYTVLPGIPRVFKRKQAVMNPRDLFDEFQKSFCKQQMMDLRKTIALLLMFQVFQMTEYCVSTAAVD